MVYFNNPITEKGIMTDTETTEALDPQHMLCHNCLEENDIHAHFCSKCRTPLSSISTLDPFMQISATGDTYIKAVSGKPSAVKTIGIILIFGSMFIGGAIGILPFIFELCDGSFFSGTMSFQKVAGGALTLFFFCIPLLVIIKALLRLRRPQKNVVTKTNENE